MPIVSRVLDHVRSAGGTSVRVREVLTDSVGRRHISSYKAQSEAQANIDMAARDVTDNLEDADERDGLEFIAAGGEPESFVLFDLTLQQWRNRLAKRFWRTTIEEDRKFLCDISPYIATFTAVQIAAALGISEVKAQKGLDRAIDLRDNVCGAMNNSDADSEDVG